MIKQQILVNKHLPVQTQQNKHFQKIFEFFKLDDKDTTAMPPT